MINKLKTMAIAVIFLLMPFAFSTSIANANPINNNNWQSGTPWIFHKNVGWISNLQRVKNPVNNQVYKQVRATISDQYGYNPTISFYNSQKHMISTLQVYDNDSSVNPHYKNLGNGWFKLTSGIKGNNNLYYETHPTNNHNIGRTALIKINNYNSVSVWRYLNGTHGKRVFDGQFHPISMN